MLITPRAYQLRLVEECRSAFASGENAVLAVSPTGSGKTVFGRIVVEGALARGNRVLWLAHRRELVTQAASKMPVRAGVIMAGRSADPASPVQVASLDTIAERSDLPPADLIVYDEAHHIVAATSRGILARYPDAKVLGLTATPSRSDGTALGDVFGRMVLGPSVRELIAEGFLVESEVIGPADEAEALAANPVDAWKRYADGRPGFLFCKTVEQSKECVEEFRANGIPAAHVDGKTAKGTRQEAIDDFTNGRIDVLSSVYVFTEGVDLPRAKVCMLARGCEHAGIFLQMVGRVLRPFNNQHALIVDLVGMVNRHGLPDDDRIWSLDGAPIRLAKREEPISQCPKCAAVWRSSKGRICNRCGFELPAPKAPPVVERELGDVRTRLGNVLRPDAHHTAKERALEGLRKKAAENHYSAKWVGMRFRAIFGHWPKGQQT